MRLDSTRAATLALVLLLVGSTVGCGSDVEGVRDGAAGPALVPLDSILLPESDSFYLGNPWPPTIATGCPYDSRRGPDRGGCM